MRIKSLALIIAPVVIAGSVLGTVYALKQETSSGDIDTNDVIVDNDDMNEYATSRFDPAKKFKKADIFPKLQIQYLYEYIEVGENGPIFNKEIVSIIIKIVVSGLGVTFGELKFEWQFLTEQHLKIKVFWYEKKGDLKNGFEHLLLIMYNIKILAN